jgi:hypothetical protein
MGDFRFEIWPTEFYVITQHFGINRHNYAQFGLPGHDGIDIRAPIGSKVFCVADGEVYRVHNKPTGHNYGIHVRVAHSNGYRTIYAHLQRTLVHQGQIVEAGTVLGMADSTGNSFGTHLHLTLKKEGARVGAWPNEIVDPTPYLLPLLGWKEPAGPYIDGWLLYDSIFERVGLAQVNAGGATLYVNANQKYPLPEGTIVILVSKRMPYAMVRVPKAAIGVEDSAFTTPGPEPPPIMATVDGWAWKRYLVVAGKQAVVGSHGVNVRAGPERTALNVGMVKAGSTVGVLGPASGQFRPIRIRRNDFIEPVTLPDPPPELAKMPPDDGYLGWVLTQYLSPLEGQLVLTSRFGVNLRNRPDEDGHNVGLVKAFATVRIAGEANNEYSPVLVRKDDILNVIDPYPDVSIPDPLPVVKPVATKPRSVETTEPGWSFTNGLTIMGNTARVADYGSNLREEPRRDARKTGYIPPDSIVVVTGPPQGEFTPVRVWERLLKPPISDDEDKDLDSLILGRARIGLHASADPDISEDEHRVFAELRPGIIKALSMHSADDIARLAATHEQAHWVIRAFLSFGERHITPGQFVNDTIKDVRRALDQLIERNVVVELHNEPNVISEGLATSWTDGEAFEKWWLDLLGRYRSALPGIRFIYPGLSTGSTVSDVKQDHIQFLEASRGAIEAADGIGVHLYWSNVFPMRETLSMLDDYISRFRDQPIWITEAGRTDGGVSAAKTAQEYLRFWNELQKRTVVQGVTYFVASATNPQFASQVWVGNDIAKLVGRR